MAAALAVAMALAVSTSLSVRSRFPRSFSKALNKSRFDFHALSLSPVSVVLVQVAVSEPPVRFLGRLHGDGYQPLDGVGVDPTSGEHSPLVLVAALEDAVGAVAGILVHQKVKHHVVDQTGIADGLNARVHDLRLAAAPNHLDLRAGAMAQDDRHADSPSR